MNPFTQIQMNDYLDAMFEVTPARWRQHSSLARATLAQKMGKSLIHCYGICAGDAADAVSNYIEAIEETAP